MEAPESTGGRVATAFGIVAAGAALGGAAGYIYMPPTPAASGTTTLQSVGAVAGAVAGAMLAGIISLAVSEFAGHDEGWTETERMAGLIGAGGVGVFGAVGLAKQLGTLKAAAASGTPQLPATSSSSPTTYTAGVQDSGRTLNVYPGDTIQVTLPSGSSATAWAWSATPGLATLTGATTAASGETVYTLTAGSSGTGQVVATTSGATFQLNLNVIAAPALAA